LHSRNNKRNARNEKRSWLDFRLRRRPGLRKKRGWLKKSRSERRKPRP